MSHLPVNDSACFRRAVSTEAAVRMSWKLQGEAFLKPGVGAQPPDDFSGGLNQSSTTPFSFLVDFQMKEGRKYRGVQALLAFCTTGTSPHLLAQL